MVTEFFRENEGFEGDFGGEEVCQPGERSGGRPPFVCLAETDVYNFFDEFRGIFGSSEVVSTSTERPQVFTVTGVLQYYT